jgi:hypothetical protein
MLQTNVVEKIKTHSYVQKLFYKTHAVYNMEKYGRTRLDISDNIIGHMPFACWLTKARNAHPEYVIPIAFLLQQWLYECATVLCCKYIACLVCNRSCSVWTFYYFCICGL